MKHVQTTLADVKPGETIIRIGEREIGARFVAMHDIREGQIVRGPRGGRYRLNASGCRELCTIETTTSRPVVRRTATVVVLRESE